MAVHPNIFKLIISRLIWYIYMYHKPDRVAQSVSQRSWVRYPSGHILSFLLPLIEEGQLSVTGENMSTKYWLTA